MTPKCRQPRYTREKISLRFLWPSHHAKGISKKNYAPSHFPSFSLHAWHLGPTTTSHCAGQNGHSLHLLLALVKLFPPKKKQPKMRKSMVFFKLKSSDLKSKSGFCQGSFVGNVPNIHVHHCSSFSKNAFASLIF